jgi:hypothetical protein
MRKANTNKRNARKAHGSTAMETGPALMILFMFLFFPLINVFALGVSYASTFTLNDLQCREAATLPQKDAVNPDGLIKKAIVDQWLHSGLGAFVQCNGKPETKMTYFAGQTDETKTQDQYVEITTKVSANPFIRCPFFFAIPGMSAPMTFEVSNRRMVENHHFV